MRKLPVQRDRGAVDSYDYHVRTEDPTYCRRRTNQNGNYYQNDTVSINGKSWDFLNKTPQNASPMVRSLHFQAKKTKP